MTIDPERVTALVKLCLFKDEELPPNDDSKQEWAKANGQVVEGITRTFAFHKGRLEEHKNTIREMISNLPDQFDKGWSFLQMCEDKDGKLWTGMHRTMEELACLGEAVGVFLCLAPREMWPIFPGGMPYYQRVLKQST